MTNYANLVDLTIACDDASVSHKNYKVEVNLYKADSDDIVKQLNLTPEDHLDSVCVADVIAYFGEESILDLLGVDKREYEQLRNRHQLR